MKMFYPLLVMHWLVMPCTGKDEVCAGPTNVLTFGESSDLDLSWKGATSKLGEREEKEEEEKEEEEEGTSWCHGMGSLSESSPDRLP